MTKELADLIRSDCLYSLGNSTEALEGLYNGRIGITGGTGFLGSWIAEVVGALNDQYDMRITLDLYARNINQWRCLYPHLSDRKDVRLLTQDVRSAFQFKEDTNFIIHAAGMPSNRMHSSDPLRVYQTSVEGIKNALEAAVSLNKLARFLNVSSCLVNGKSDLISPLREADSFAFPAGHLHSIYADAKRSSESIASIYRNQFRLPLTTVRPFTFMGPYQQLEAPWALNAFINDAMKADAIRIHGDGGVIRSYMYGSDAAIRLLTLLVRGEDGSIYNLGGATPITHFDLAKLVSKISPLKPRIELNTDSQGHTRSDCLYPDLENINKVVGFKPVHSIEHAIERSFEWFKNKAMNDYE